MKVLRLKINQRQAHYKKPECVDNKMTYPLPPVSTVIGALHAACSYTSYHPMDIGIKGRYRSLYKRPYTDHCYLNSVQDDRGTLVKEVSKGSRSRGHKEVARAMNSQGNSFYKEITVSVKDRELFEEYRGIRTLVNELNDIKKNKIKPFKKALGDRKKKVKEEQKNISKDDPLFLKLKRREKKLTSITKYVDKRVSEYEEEHINNELSKYATLTTSPKYYEILTEVELIIHIRAEDSVIEDIKNNIYNLQSLGRSEDTVTLVEEPKEVEITPVEEYFEGADVRALKTQYPTYISLEKEANVRYKEDKKKGTMYFLNKNYEIKEGKRVFKKVRALYTANFKVDKKSENLFIDDDRYVVSFL